MGVVVGWSSQQFFDRNELLQLKAQDQLYSLKSKQINEQ
jgi:hypothetical protein